MRIQHNIMAMNSYRNYNNNTSALSKNLEKLSSGYKINRAGDDAAGLAISEKMRAQIKGLEAAQKNVKDGTSLVKTAEGAMQEIQDMLSRMKYLATQSANGTYDNPVDRKALQDEVDQLNSEIDRIADSANFNGINLLDGTLGSRDLTVDGTNKYKANGIKKVEITGGAPAKSDAATNEGGPATAANFSFILAGATTPDGDTTVTMDNAAINGIKWVAVGQDEEHPGNSTGETGKFTGVNGGSVTFKAVRDEDTMDDAKAADLEHYLGMTVTVTVDAAEYDPAAKTYAYADNTVDITEYDVASGLRLQIGDTSDDYNQLTVSIADMHVRSLGISAVNIGTIDGASDAIENIKDAINKVSSVRGLLGATQNRLDHTANNLSVMTENITDAESTIRDTDVADEMMAYTKNNILIQSAQAMLAQSNAVPQGVLQLLQ